MYPVKTNRSNNSDDRFGTIQTFPSKLSEHRTSFVEIGGLCVYAEQLKRPRAALLETLSQIKATPESEVHLLRHFSSATQEYIASLLGQPITRRVHGSSAIETAVIDQAMIDKALATKGSKFGLEVEGFANPRELVAAVREHALSRAADDDLPVFDGGFCEKLYLSIEMGRTLGRDAVIAINQLDQAAMRLRQEPRGKLGSDDFSVNIAPGHPGAETSKLSAIIGIIKGVPHIFSAFPGALAPDFPKDHQGSDEREYNKTFWQRHAFIE